MNINNLSTSAQHFIAGVAQTAISVTLTAVLAGAKSVWRWKSAYVPPALQVETSVANSKTKSGMDKSLLSIKYPLLRKIATGEVLFPTTTETAISSPGFIDVKLSIIYPPMATMDERLELERFITHLMVTATVAKTYMVECENTY